MNIFYNINGLKNWLITLLKISITIRWEAN